MTQPSFSGYHRVAIALLVLTLCSAVVAPAFAITKYTGGSPAFSAAVNGVNEFSPGQEATLQVLIENSGVSSLKQLDHGTIAPEDLPTTAKQVTVGLASGTNNILIRTDSQMAGTIPGSGGQKTVNFIIKVTENATEGEYQLPLNLQYQYLRPIEQETGDIFQFTYNKGDVTIPLTIRIKPQAKVGILEMTSDPLVAGSEGYIHVKIQNAGPEDGRMAAAQLIRNGKSPVIPTDSTVFLGNFPSGATAECKYKVSIGKDALNKTYPVDIAVTYTNREGTVVTTQATTLGIPVNGKTPFTVISSVPSIAPGAESTIEVRYRNDGEITAYDAQVRLTGHDPISTTANTAFLGSVKPGESATAKYVITADSGAETKEYLFDSKIRYRDAFSNSMESDTIPVAIQVSPAGAGTGGLPGILIFFIGIIVIAGAGVVLWNHHRSGKMR